MDYSNFWKLDKIDKIVISFICIIVTIFFVFTTFSQASIEISPFSITPWSLTGNTVIYNPTRTFYQFEVIPNNKYTIQFSPFSSPQLVLRNNKGDEPFSLGDQTITLSSVTDSDVYSFICPEDVYYVAVVVKYDSSVSFYNDNYNSYFDFAVNSLVNTLTTDFLWSMFKNVVPFIGVTIVVVLGYFLLSKLIKVVSKMK